MKANNTLQKNVDSHKMTWLCFAQPNFLVKLVVFLF